MPRPAPGQPGTTEPILAEESGLGGPALLEAGGGAEQTAAEHRRLHGQKGADGASRRHSGCVDDASKLQVLGSLCCLAACLALATAAGAALAKASVPTAGALASARQARQAAATLSSLGVRRLEESSANVTQSAGVAGTVHTEAGRNGDMAVNSDMDDGPVCLDAAEGEICHRLVVWAVEDGLRLHAEEFAGLTRRSSFGAFQAVLHQRHPELCPAPCADAHSPAALSVEAAVLQPVFSFASTSGVGCNYGRGGDLPAHAGCFVVRGGRLLATKLTYDGRRYDIPGGQTNWREPARCTAHRETLEETGYNVAPRELLAVVRNNFHLYRCELLQSHPVMGHDHEISWVGWLSASDIQDRVRMGHWRFPEAYRYADWVR